jgi:threonine synthase
MERLLLALTIDPEEVAGYMAELASTGRYQVSDKVLKKLQGQFAAGFCDDEQTRAQIFKTWKEHGYLIDPHTAVAFHVLEEYRAKTGDKTPTIAVSTASPFKFCAAVLDALGIRDKAPGLDILDQLSEVTGCPIPAPLAGLRGKAPRFKTWVEKEDMMDQVLKMLS